ncbi:MAG: acyl-CoA dehydrogenase [Alphaproteobacteria bacterium]|nr:MAG: acyl-CoA dehydrogenase [Alphaproteobacteria bacterium]
MSGKSLEDWIGRTQEVEDALQVEQARRLAATFDLDLTIEAGALLPPGWQWIYFNPVVSAHDLDVDGHPKRGGFLPPVPLPRRMWAAGEMTIDLPLRLGGSATRLSTIEGVTTKEGKSGPLVFVSVGHVYLQDGQACLRERQDIVYREAPTGGFVGRRKTDPRNADWQEACMADEVLLFRYSAVTFNAHRIHHDLAYVRDVEGYPGLVVHGPLMATQLAGFAGRSLGSPLKSFSFRAVQPLFVNEAYLLKGLRAEHGGQFWIESAEGHEIMMAKAEI